MAEVLWKDGKLGRSYYSKVRYEGRDYKKVWGRVSKTIAKEKHMKFESDVRGGVHQKNQKKILFDKLAERYLEYSKMHKKSYERDETSVRTLLMFFKEKYITEIHPFLIDKYKKERLEKPYFKKIPKPSTVNRELACLKNMFGMAKRWRLIADNPVKEVKLFKEEKKEVTILSAGEEEKLFIELNKHLKSRHARDMVLVALHSGMRFGEIARLEIDKVNFDNSMLRVSKTKSGEAKDVPMNETLTKVLKLAIEGCPKDKDGKFLYPYVFVNSKTGKPYTSIKTSFNNALKKIGLKEKGFTFHDLRHVWTSRMCEEGIAETAIQKIGGWKTRSMINRYSHPSIDYMRTSVEKLDKNLSLNLSLDENSEESVERGEAISISK